MASKDLLVNSNSQGKLWGISVGPGDDEWLTLKGLRILQSVEVVACPQNRQGKPGMAYNIVKSHLRSPQKILPLDLPFVRDPVQLQQAWDAAGEELLPLLTQGQDVAFITEGDASLYSTFSYVAQSVHRLDSSIEITTVPGVCSPLAAMATLNMPLSLGAEKIAILPALYDISELTATLEWAEVIVLMKVSSVFGQVWQLLKEKGLLEKASLVERVGSPEEKRYPHLVNLADYQPPYFSILIVRRHDYRF